MEQQQQQQQRAAPLPPSALPPAPVFGIAGGQGLGGKYLNLDDIFVDCFLDGDGDLGAQLNNGGGGGAAASGGGASSGVNNGGVGGVMGMGPGMAGMAPGALGLGQFGQGMMPGMGMQQMLHAPLPSLLGPPGMQHATPMGHMGLGQAMGMPPHGMQGFMQSPLTHPVGPPRGLHAAAAAAAAAGGGAAAGGSSAGAGAAAGDVDEDSKARRNKRPRTGPGAMAAGSLSMGQLGLGGVSGIGMGGGASSALVTTGRNMSEQQKLDRRERNREHAKRSRVRKKFLLESLQKSVTALQDENEKLRAAIRDNLGEDAAKDLLAKAETSSLLAATPGEATKVLDDPDYSLVKALQTAQQNFVITDPTLPDNPIVFASQGFLDLTGYSLDQVLGRNCRFLQGPDTDPKAVEKIRKAIDKGVDMSVCLLNYRVDGSTFWNQFFIAALRDAESKIINYVGVQCKVSAEFVRAVQRQEEEGTSHNEEEEEGDDDDDDGA